jgi:hypothetical protein
MRRPAAAALTALLVLPGGCSDRTADYCAALEREQATLERLSAQAAPAQEVMSRGVEVFERLRDAAPEDLRDEWTTYVNAWHGLADALVSAGAGPEEFREGERPEGMGSADYDAVRDAAETLRSEPVVDASVGIEQHAGEVCGVDIGSGL